MSIERFGNAIVVLLMLLVVYHMYDAVAFVNASLSVVFVAGCFLGAAAMYIAGILYDRE